MSDFKNEQFHYDNDENLIYEGNIVPTYDIYNKRGKHKVKFTFVSSNATSEQGIILDLGGNFDGDIFWESKKYDIPKRKFPTLDLFEKYFGKEFILEIDLREGEIYIFNGAIENGFVSYCSGLCAMFIEDVAANKKRYQCNSPISKKFTFDDLIFEIEILD